MDPNTDAHANKIRSSTKNKWERRGDRSWKVGLVSIALSLQQPILGDLVYRNPRRSEALQVLLILSYQESGGFQAVHDVTGPDMREPCFANVP